MQVLGFFNEHFPHIGLVSGPCLWDSETGVELSKAEQKARGLGLRKVTTTGTKAGHQWPVNSPDLNVAEHAVGGVCDTSRLAAGSYSKTEMKKHITRLWNTHPQVHLDSSILSMPSRLEQVIKRGGLALQKGVGY